MVYSGALGSTNAFTNEYFNTEDFRVISGNYGSQSDITAAGNVWNSQNHMTGGGATGHTLGLVTANGYDVSPLKIGAAGDTRNTVDGGSLQSHSGNPNYS